MRVLEGAEVKAIYPGSFDPITYGHLDIINQAARMFDELIVAVGMNERKKPLFSPRERKDLINRFCLEMANVRTESFSGLVVDYAIEEDADILVRGLRSFTDFEFEFQFAAACRSMCPRLEIVYFMTRPEHLFISSSLVKEVAAAAPNGKLEERIGRMVGPPVMQALADTLRCGIW